MKLLFVVGFVHMQMPHFTTIWIAHQAHRLRHDVAFMSALNFSLGNEGDVLGQVVIPKYRRNMSQKEFLISLKDRANLSVVQSLSSFDFILLRNNPYEHYFMRSFSHNPSLDFGRILEKRGVSVINRPDGLSKADTKIYITRLPEKTIPRTIITRNFSDVLDFLEITPNGAIVKPWIGFGGKGVSYITSETAYKFKPLIELISREGYVIVQEYLPEARHGEKRILLWRGKPLKVGSSHATYLRVSTEGEMRNNIHVGAMPFPCSLDEQDLALCEKVGTKLHRDGLDFVGIDVIDHKVIDVNVFCPGGFRIMNELYGINFIEYFLHQLEEAHEHD